jgi:hypothetical protein
MTDGIVVSYASNKMRQATVTDAHILGVNTVPVICLARTERHGARKHLTPNVIA